MLGSENIFCIEPLFGPRREETFLRGVGSYTGADQLANPRSLVYAFVVRTPQRLVFLRRGPCAGK